MMALNHPVGLVTDVDRMVMSETVSLVSSFGQRRAA
jgi:hypothetical protein